MSSAEKKLSDLKVGDMGIVLDAMYYPGVSPYPYQDNTLFKNEIFRIIERSESGWKIEIVNALDPEAKNKVPRYGFIYENDLNKRVKIIDKTALQKIAASIAEAISG